jgi:hypothetical protein
VEQTAALVVALPPQSLASAGRTFAHNGFSAERARGSLWLNFTPHRLIRRYSEYAWLNKPVSSPLAS